MQAEFGRLIEANRALLFKVASAYCADPGEREDLVQEIAAALWRSFPRYDRRRPFRTWAFRVALNVAISFGRSARRRAVLADDASIFETLPDTSSAADEDLQTLLAHIVRLEPLDRALVLLYLEGYDHATSAGILGISPSNAATKVQRIKERLRRAIAQEQAKEYTP